MPKSKMVPQFEVGNVVNLRRIPKEVHHIPRCWQVGSDDDVALTEFVLAERYRIAHVLEGTWDEVLIYRIALTLEGESSYLQGQLTKFREGQGQ